MAKAAPPRVRITAGARAREHGDRCGGYSSPQTSSEFDVAQSAKLKLVNEKPCYITLVSSSTVTGVLKSGTWGGNAKGRLVSVTPGAIAALYVTGVHAFAGIVEVTSGYYYHVAPIWSDATYPHRVSVSTIVASSDPTCWVDVRPLIPELSFIKKPEHYGAYFRSSWFQISESDLACIEQALRDRIRS